MIGRAVRGFAALAALFSLSITPTAALASDQPDSARALQSLDSRLFNIGWRLVSGNAPFCENAHPALGLLLHDAQSYREPEAIKRSLGLSGDIGVQAVAPDSPAEQAGIKANAALTRLDGSEINAAFPSIDPRWQRMVDLNAALEQSLADDGTANLSWTTGDGSTGEALIEGVPACASRFEVLSRGGRAIADGTRVMIGRNSPGFDYPEDEFAAMVAHELAHNLLGHRALLDRIGRKRSLVRLTERDADRLMPWLLANAGWEPEAAIRFMERWGPRHGGWLFRKRTHDGWDERRDFIAAEVAIIERVMADEGAADWKRHFVRLADSYGSEQ